MLSRSRPRFRLDDAERIVRERFGLEAAGVSELPSERDQNFHMRESPRRELVLKIASSAEPRSILEFQNQALARVGQRDPGLPVPRLLRARNGEEIETVEGGNGASFHVRLFERLPGKPIAEARPQSMRLLRSVGSALGRLDRALEGFAHPEVQKLIGKLDFARVDLFGTEKLVTPDGKTLAAGEWGLALQVAYTPTIVFFDETGREVFRIDAYLRPFHLGSSLDYVASKAYVAQPSFQRYLQTRADSIRKAGGVVELW